MVPQGCIKLGLVRAGAGVREVVPPLPSDHSNPAGLAAGGRFGDAGETTTGRKPEILASWSDARGYQMQFTGLNKAHWMVPEVSPCWT